MTFVCTLVHELASKCVTPNIGRKIIQTMLNVKKSQKYLKKNLGKSYDKLEKNLRPAILQRCALNALFATMRYIN